MTLRLEAQHHLRRGQIRHPRHPPPRLRVGDYGIRFTEEYPDSWRIHTVRNRKAAYR